MKGIAYFSGANNPRAWRRRAGWGSGWVPLLMLGALVAISATGKEKPPVQYAIPLPPPPDFSELDWLVGEWAGKTTGRSAPGEIRFSAAYDLGKRFMVLRGEVSLTATTSTPDFKESWMGVLTASSRGPGYILRTFSSTGFIARYWATVDGPEVRFIPEGGEKPPPGWLFRRLIQRTGTDEFTDTVEVAPPSKPFFDYYTARLHRVSVPEKNAKTP